MLALKTRDGDGREWTVMASQTEDDVVHARMEVNGVVQGVFHLPMPVALAVASVVTAVTAGVTVEWSTV